MFVNSDFSDLLRLFNANQVRNSLVQRLPATVRSIGPNRAMHLTPWAGALINRRSSWWYVILSSLTCIDGRR